MHKIKVELLSINSRQNVTFKTIFIWMCTVQHIKMFLRKVLIKTYFFIYLFHLLKNLQILKHKVRYIKFYKNQFCLKVLLYVNLLSYKLARSILNC